MFKQDKVLSIILIIAVLASLFVLARRYSVEQRNRAVEIAVDYTELRQIASSMGRPLQEVLREFREAGATSIAVEVETIGSLIDSGRVRLSSRQSGAETITALSATSSETAKRLQAVLETQRRTATGTTVVFRPDVAEGVDLEGVMDYNHLRNIPIGLPLEAVEAAKSEGLNLVPRFMNYPGIDEATLRRTMKDAADTGARIVIFGGDQVAGFRGLVESTADAFADFDMYYGSIEFGRQKGDARLARGLEDRLVRVHSIPQAEMGQIGEASAVERYTRAARERNIRLIYVRLFDLAAEDPVGANSDYVRSIAGSLSRYGFEPKASHPLADPSPAAWLLALIGVGVAAGIGLLISSLVAVPLRTMATGIAIAAVVFAVLAAAPVDIGRKLVALTAAFSFPTLAVIYAGRGVAESPTKGSGAASAAARFLSAVAVSTVGGLLIAGLLSSRSFMLKIDQFSGIKLAQLVPLLLVLGVYAAGIAWQRGNFAEQKKRAGEALRSLFAQPILVWQAIGLMAVLVLVALVLARSGNEPGVGVSAMELKARALLDQLLYVRPRTKEFMLGHPLLFLGIVFAVTGRRAWAVPLIVLGTIGQVSVLNTFCHIHTPIAISLIRVAIGAVTGLAIGLVVYWIVRRVSPPRAEGST